jgi:phosphonate transport system permease protein
MLMVKPITPLPPDRAAALAQAYDGAVAASRRRVWAGLAVLVVLTGLAAKAAEVRPWVLAGNIGKFTDYLAQILPALTLGNLGGDLAEWYWGWPKWLALLGETLLMAYLGTLLGAIGGFLLCFAAAGNVARSRAGCFLVRRALEFCRTVPEIVFALIFVIAFGLGPMVGVLALAIHTTGALGKLFAGRIETLRFAVLPQVLSNFVSYGLLRFEINVRGAGVMGFVGAGGIGQELLVAIRNFYYADVSAILVLIILTVMAIDLGTERLRHHLLGGLR